MPVCEVLVILFRRFVRESETIPARGAIVMMRIPTGDNSTGVDARSTMRAMSISM